MKKILFAGLLLGIGFYIPTFFEMMYEIQVPVMIPFALLPFIGIIFGLWGVFDKE